MDAAGFRIGLLTIYEAFTTEHSLPWYSAETRNKASGSFIVSVIANTTIDCLSIKLLLLLLQG